MSRFDHKPRLESTRHDIVIVGGGGAGLSAAIAIAEQHPQLSIALVSKVVPMRSHTVAAEGGAAGVVSASDGLDLHFRDTVVGGEWLCDQAAVDYFVARCHEEMVRLEHWGCPWSRGEDGYPAVRNFGGMSTARTWFAADKTGFHILHTLFQTSLRFPRIQRFDEYFVHDLLVDDGCCRGVVAIDIASGDFHALQAGAVIMATGGAGRVYRQNTNAGILTGDGLGLALRHGVALRDMEFVQFHPTTLPGSGVLITEGCRGEGAYLTNRHGHRYLQDYGLGPEVREPVPKTMELGPRDRLSQAFWHEQQAGRTVDTPNGPAVQLELMHLGRRKIAERLPFISELAKTFVGVDPACAPIPVCPSVHYTMGGIATDITTATALPGLYACGECASVGIHGANRLGSNSLAELLVFGREAGLQAAGFAADQARQGTAAALAAQARESAARAAQWLARPAGGLRLAELREQMTTAMQDGVGIYRDAERMASTCESLENLSQLLDSISLDDRSRCFNTEWLSAIELGFTLDVARCIAHAALNRRESRGSHQRLDGYNQRDDDQFLRHSLATLAPGQPPQIHYRAVNITRLPPGERRYGGGSATEHKP
ncbi:MAG: fumarate reductase (quinol) flavoprotein subunit [Wenzhouxiangella sp.]|nr:fumarate reductase (quinol) flavoprotein subunit [Wenzhouxiangella sp.]TVR94407.1 MAG: fumarate reductase (quinol) flavoprotein subunit [Wenzhouxiangellaceae bacterium]